MRTGTNAINLFLFNNVAIFFIHDAVEFIEFHIAILGSLPKLLIISFTIHQVNFVTQIRFLSIGINLFLDILPRNWVPWLEVSPFRNFLFEESVLEIFEIRMQVVGLDYISREGLL